MTALSESKQNSLTIALLALMLIVHALISYASVRTKSPTADEPLHALGGFMRIHYGDFRIDPEDPPLSFYWAMLPHPGDVLKVDLTTPTWDYTLKYPWAQWNWVGPTFFRTSGFDPDAFLDKSRAVMTALGVMLGIVIAWWAWGLGGRLAAIFACGLYCFDPNFLAHVPLVKNDVSLTLIMCGLMFALWRAGEQLTITRAIAIALLMAAALSTKFSGTLIVPMLVALLIARALIARPWLVLGRIVAKRSTKLAVAGAMIAFAAIVSYVGIWAAYGFRYSITPDPKLSANVPMIRFAAARNELLIKHPYDDPQEPDIMEQMKSPARIVRLMGWINDRRLLPEAWSVGLIETYAATIRRPSFILEKHAATGWWYYFPFAFLVKTPLSTLAILVLALVVKRGRRFDWWSICCLAIPFAIYGISALVTHLNLGVRHILPIIPLMYIWAGATLANARVVVPRFVTIATSICGAGLLIESLAGAPHYIAYFNAPSRLIGQPIELLGDSNLDWGQDLRSLRKWQQENPDVELFLDYFGGCEPAYYVKHTLVMDPDKPGVAPPPAAIGTQSTSGRRQVLAVSASKLQNIYPPYNLRPFYEYIKRHKPFKVLGGGTIYLYELPLQD